MKTFKITVTYEVEIVDESEPTFLHLMDAVYQMQEHGTPHEGITDVKPPLVFRTEELTMSFELLDT